MLKNLSNEELQKKYYEYKELIEDIEVFGIRDLKYYSLLEGEMARRHLLE